MLKKRTFLHNFKNIFPYYLDHLKTLFINANGLSLKLLADGIQDFYSEQRGLRRVAANSIVLNVKLAYCSSLRSVIERIEEKLVSVFGFGSIWRFL